MSKLNVINQIECLVITQIKILLLAVIFSSLFLPLSQTFLLIVRRKNDDYRKYKPSVAPSSSLVLKTFNLQQKRDNFIGSLFIPFPPSILLTISDSFFNVTGCSVTVYINIHHIFSIRKIYRIQSIFHSIKKKCLN